MPLNLSFTHLAVVGIVALVVLGPDRLPEVARTAGNLWREWKRVRGDLEGEVREVMSEFTEPFREHFEGINETMRGVVDDIRNPPAAPPEAITVPPLAAAAAAVAVPPLSAALPALAPSTGLVSPGPEMRPELPSLGPPPDPGTFVPFDPSAGPEAFASAGPPPGPGDRLGEAPPGPAEGGLGDVPPGPGDRLGDVPPGPGDRLGEVPPGPGDLVPAESPPA